MLGGTCCTEVVTAPPFSDWMGAGEGALRGKGATEGAGGVRGADGNGCIRGLGPFAGKFGDVGVRFRVPYPRSWLKSKFCALPLS